MLFDPYGMYMSKEAKKTKHFHFKFNMSMDIGNRQEAPNTSQCCRISEKTFTEHGILVHV